MVEIQRVEGPGGGLSRAGLVLLMEFIEREGWADVVGGVVVERGEDDCNGLRAMFVGTEELVPGQVLGSDLPMPCLNLTFSYS